MYQPCGVDLPRSSSEIGHKEALIANANEAELRHKEWSLRFYLDTVERRDAHKRELPPDRDHEAIVRLIESSSRSQEKHSLIRAYLSMNELLATGVNLGLHNLEIVDRFDGPAIVARWSNYKSWVDQERVKYEESTLYEELETLARRLVERHASH
jgi:hypothetical protein